MATDTTTEIRVTINAIPALNTALDKGERDAAKSAARYVTYADVLAKEAAKLDLSEDDAAIALKQSYVLATKGFDVQLVKLGTAKNAKLEIKLPDQATYSEEDVKKELDRLKSDFSRVMRLAFVEGDAKKELELAHSHNSKIQDYRKRIGVNDLLEIARGNVTFDALLNPPTQVERLSAIAETAAASEAAVKAETPATPAGETPADPAASTPTQAPTGSHLTVQDRFQGALEACKMDGLTYPDAQRILDEVYKRNAK